MSAVNNDGNNLKGGGQGGPKSNGADMQNTFIQLMVAQIKNQDPTKPVDSSEFLSQFATMSQVQSMEKMALLTENNMVLLENLQYLSASTLVGQVVKVSVDQLNLQDKPVQAEVELEHSASDLTVILTDANGVKTEIPLPPGEPGRVAFEIDPVALGLPPGKYGIEVKSSSGETLGVEVKSKVNSVRLGSDGPVLSLDGVGDVPFYKITEFSEASLLSGLGGPTGLNPFQRSLSQFPQGLRP
jgi:flagellar basal-body rod modification protein FlgD